jgi:hypothetical protein
MMLRIILSCLENHRSVLHFVGAAIDLLVSALTLTLWFDALLLAGLVSLPDRTQTTGR